MHIQNVYILYGLYAAVRFPGQQIMIKECFHMYVHSYTEGAFVICVYVFAWISKVVILLCKLQVAYYTKQKSSAFSTY